MFLIRSSACSIRQAASTLNSVTAGSLSSIQLRLANRRDVPSIQLCNLACLPENYNSNFFHHNLSQWPDLSIVAVEENKDLHNELLEDYQSRNSFTFSGNIKLNEPKVVAYVLGKVETRSCIDYDDRTSSRVHRAERIGHVTSLAVLKEFRQRGIAKALMHQLHHHLQKYGITSCGLHVRTSNAAACRLYKEDGYQIDEIIKSYYQDGEDAYFMRRSFNNDEATENIYENPYDSCRNLRKTWVNCSNGLCLPRYHHSNINKSSQYQVEESFQDRKPVFEI